MIEEVTNVSPMGRIEKINIEDHMKESYINYSMSVIVSRALPTTTNRLVSRLVSSEMYSVSSTHTVTHRFMMRWCVWLSLGLCVILS